MSVKMRMPKLTESLSAPLQTDTKPYLLKPVPIGNRERLKLIGGTVAVNQLSHSSFSSNIRATTTVSGTSTVIKENRTSSNASFGAYEALAIPNGHKVFLYANVSAISVTNLSAVAFYFRKSGGTQVSERLTTTSTGRASTIMALTDASLNLACLISNTSAKTGTTDTVTVQDVVATDLTQMFGSTIADYAYTLEQGHAGDGIAWLKSYGFLAKDYYPYDAGSLLSVKTSGHVVTGKNLFDETQFCDLATDYEYISDSYRCKKIQLLPFTQYTVSHRAGVASSSPIVLINSMSRVNQAGYFDCRTASSEKTFTTDESGCLYIGAVNATDAQIEARLQACKVQIEYGESVTEYEPYKTTTYPLSDIELRGIPKLVSGAIEYDGDSYEADGTVTRRYGVVTFDGDESIGVATLTNTTRITISLTGAKYPDPQQVSNYLPLVVSFAQDTEHFYINTTAAILFIAQSKCGTTVDSVKAYLASHPLTIVYELATPTTETADAYENPQVVETGGTESFIDGRTVEMPVGNISEYCEAVKSVSIGMRMGKGLSVKMRMGGEL